MDKQPNNPDSLKELNALEIDYKIKDFTTSLSSDVQTERQNRSYWESAIDRYRNLRYGVRNSKTKPWPDCANYVIGLIDEHIQHLKPHYINLAFSVSPICNFEPFGAEDIDAARKKEILYDWRMKTQVKFFDQYNYGVDKLLQDGAVIFKVIWKFETNTYTKSLDLEDFNEETLRAIYDPRITDELLFSIIQEEIKINLEFEENIKEIGRVIKEFREGKKSFDLTLQEVKTNRPQVIARDLREDVILPLDTLIFEDNLDNARFIDDRIWTTENDIKLEMESGKYEKYTENEVRAWVGKNIYDKKYLTSPQLKSDDSILLHEVCCWYDMNDDGIKERCIVTYPDAAPGMVLRFIGLPYDHGQWPYTLVKRELNDPTVYSSRGIPAIDDDYQTGITTAFNQAIDNGTIVNTPKVVYRRNSITNIRNARYVPGEAVETTGPTTDYEIRQQMNMSQGTLFQQAQFLKAWADQRIGDLSSGLTSKNNQAGLGQSGQKTAKEINLIQTMQSGIQSLDLIVFQMQMARVYSQIDALYDQFVDDEEYQFITNEQPIKISRREIQGKFNIIPNGRLDNSNPEMRANKVFNLMKIFVNDPDIRQYELKKLFLQDYDSKISTKILLTEEEIDKRNQMQMQNMQQQKQMMLDEGIGMREMQDALDIKKEMALSQVQGKKFAPG